MIIENGLKQKLKKCMIGATAALVLSGCVTTNKFDKAIMRKEVPHMEETSLNAKLVKKQKPIDNEFLLQEDAILNKFAFSELFDVQLDGENRAEQETMIVQKLADDCQAMKTLTQRAASHYKVMEQKTKQERKVTDFEVLGIVNNICSYRYSTIHGGRVKNQGLDENTDLDAVRAAYRHSMHKFLDAKILALTDALPNELVAQEKYELGYGVFMDPDFVKYNQQTMEEKMHNSTYYAMEDMVNYVVYEYRHSLQVENPAEIESKIEKCLSQIQQGLNAYGYQGKGAEKDLELYQQGKQGLIEIMSRVPDMCGSPAEIEALVDELGSGLVVLPLTRDLHNKNVDIAKFNGKTKTVQLNENGKSK